MAGQTRPTDASAWRGRDVVDSDGDKLGVTEQETVSEGLRKEQNDTEGDTKR